ncbi:rhodanese-like domain-containing protein [Variovorax sp. J22R133]|uniref:rhodanese-like domain-containing protein n=1 Tax=Variovorax brevis TaxID=3053503 RepID=UPI0025765982|nr:rhodanese-like domain-containing protein [Variovorax sp. J22R133]MDM0111890.1 rhodanese-like domain-containing protein [Variovorax sp. J22R133]
MIEQILPADLAAWFGRDATATAVLLDVREPWEVQAASVTPRGFTLLAIPMNEIPSRIAELDTASRIACLCHHGARSQHVANFLGQRGFSSLANVAGGIDGWARQHDPAVPRY